MGVIAKHTFSGPGLGHETYREVRSGIPLDVSTGRVKNYHDPPLDLHGSSSIVVAVVLTPVVRIQFQASRPAVVIIS
jgi:hypothetical protein